jgi:hypothetical protein
MAFELAHLRDYVICLCDHVIWLCDHVIWLSGKAWVV